MNVDRQAIREHVGDSKVSKEFQYMLERCTCTPSKMTGLHSAHASSLVTISTRSAPTIAGDARALLALMI